MNKKRVAAIVAVFLATAAIVGGWFYARSLVADEYYITDNAEFDIASLPVTVGVSGDAAAVSASGGAGRGTARLFGAIPLKSVRLNTVSQKTVLTGGEAFGLKMYTNGLIVVGFSDIATASGKRCPAKEAGIEKGDLLKTLNGVRLQKNSDVTELINACNGADCAVTLERGGEERSVTLKPAVSSEDGEPKAGMWVRDSAAGIGTVSFYDPKSQLFVGLGHGIYDVDTEKLMPAAEGEIVTTTITGVKRGAKGAPGELRGIFEQDNVIGELYGNTALGVYGKLSSAVGGEPAEIALKQEVEVGAAKVISPAVGGGSTEYAIDIVSIINDDRGSGRNMVIRITDPRLIELTGGIVQGMSGSPILQNGKLIGAVTHVLVDDPTTGYAIFAERMYELIK